MSTGPDRIVLPPGLVSAHRNIKLADVVSGHRQAGVGDHRRQRPEAMFLHRGVSQVGYRRRSVLQQLARLSGEKLAGSSTVLLTCSPTITNGSAAVQDRLVRGRCGWRRSICGDHWVLRVSICTDGTTTHVGVVLETSQNRPPASATRSAPVSLTGRSAGLGLERSAQLGSGCRWCWSRPELRSGSGTTRPRAGLAGAGEHAAAETSPLPSRGLA